MTYHPPTLEVLPTRIRSSYSALNAHRDCEARWLYRYVLRIKKPDVGPKPELHFGSWWGAMTSAEGLERGRRLGSLKADPEASKIKGPDDGPEWDQRTVTVKDVFEGAKEWWKSRDLETQEVWLEKLGEDLPHRLRTLYIRWMDEFKEQRKNEHPLGFEVRWTRTLDRPEDDTAWLGPEGHELLGVDLVGYIDEVYWDAGRNLVVVRDKKSHKVLKAATAVDDMMDSQLHVYAWGGTPIIEGWGLGKPGAVAYDRARSVKPSSPTITKTAGTLSKATSDYDLHTYLQFARSDTRPTAEITQWLEDVMPYEAVNAETGEMELFPPKRLATQDQIDYVRNLPAGQFWSNTKVDESPLAFLLTGVKKGLPKFGVYAEEQSVVDKLSTPTARSIWFQRTRVPVNRNLVEGHLRAALDTATDAWRTQRRFEITGDAPRSLGKACDWCDFASLCRARLFGGADGEYDLREHGLVAPDGRTLLIDGKLEMDTRTPTTNDSFDLDLERMQ